MFSRRSAQGWLIAYLAASAVSVLAGFLGARELGVATKPLLMPLLLAFFMASLGGLHHRLATWVKAALVCSWLGDLLLMGPGETFFLLGLLGFLAAQICYIIGFRPYAALGPLRARPWLVVPYVACGIGLLLLLLPDLGGLGIPVAVYAAALVTMAVLATGVSPATAAGAILFLLSDSLIALTRLSHTLPDSARAWILPTYLAGQLLIVMGVLQNLGRATAARDLSATG